jgi:hypothetical protein
LDIWIVIDEERHGDVNALPFSTFQQAQGHARSLAPDGAEPAPLTEGMTRSGWVLCIPYGTEGECVRVIHRTLDAPG